jgi:hypothetical protein
MPEVATNWPELLKKIDVEMAGGRLTARPEPFRAGSDSGWEVAPYPALQQTAAS